MSVTVWKFLLDGPDCALSIPTGARLVLVGRDPLGGGPALWFECNPQAEKRSRRFLTHGTGHEVKGSQHIGSAICGPFVWHIYEEPTE